MSEENKNSGNESLTPIVATFGLGLGGNSRLARSARAKLQRRDRKGRFAEMGGGFIFNILGKDGSIFKMAGRVISGVGESDGIQVEVVGSEDLPDGVYTVPSGKGEAVKALLPQSALKGLPDVDPIASRNDAIPYDDVMATRVDAPEGWSSVNYYPDFKRSPSGANIYGEKVPMFTSEDGYVAVYDRNTDEYVLHRPAFDEATGQVRNPASGPQGEAVGNGDWSDITRALLNDQDTFGATIDANEQKRDEESSAAKAKGRAAYLDSLRRQMNKDVDYGSLTDEQIDDMAESTARETAKGKFTPGKMKGWRKTAKGKWVEWDEPTTPGSYEIATEDDIAREKVVQKKKLEEIRSLVQSGELTQPSEAPGTVDLDVSGVSAPLEKQIQDAVDGKQKIRFSYNNKDREVTPTRVWKNPKTGMTNVTADDGKTYTIEKMDAAELPSGSEKIEAAPNERVDSTYLEGLEKDLEKEAKKRKKQEEKGAARADKDQARYDDLVGNPDNWTTEMVGYPAVYPHEKYIGPELPEGMIPVKPQSVREAERNKFFDDLKRNKADGGGEPPTTPPPAPPTGGPEDFSGMSDDELRAEVQKRWAGVTRDGADSRPYEEAMRELEKRDAARRGEPPTGGPDGKISADDVKSLIDSGDSEAVEAVMEAFDTMSYDDQVSALDYTSIEDAINDVGITNDDFSPGATPSELDYARAALDVLRDSIKNDPKLQKKVVDHIALELGERDFNEAFGNLNKPPTGGPGEGFSPFGGPSPDWEDNGDSEYSLDTEIGTYVVNPEDDGKYSVTRFWGNDPETGGWLNEEEYTPRFNTPEEAKIWAEQDVAEVLDSQIAADQEEARLDDERRAAEQRRFAEEDLREVGEQLTTPILDEARGILNNENDSRNGALRDAIDSAFYADANEVDVSETEDFLKRNGVDATDDQEEIRDFFEGIGLDYDSLQRQMNTSENEEGDVTREYENGLKKYFSELYAKNKDSKDLARKYFDFKSNSEDSLDRDGIEEQIADAVNQPGETPTSGPYAPDEWGDNNRPGAKPSAPTTAPRTPEEETAAREQQAANLRFRQLMDSDAEFEKFARDRLGSKASDILAEWDARGEGEEGVGAPGGEPPAGGGPSPLTDFLEQEFDSMFETPDGAYKPNIFELYVPTGGDDSASDFYTDDPSRLAEAFPASELVVALNEAVMPSRGNEASGYGNLNFGDGDEQVPAEAIAEALELQGTDPAFVLSNIYDAGLDPERGETNVDRYNSMRKEFDAATSRPDVIPKTPAQMTTLEARNLNKTASKQKNARSILDQMDAHTETSPKMLELAEDFLDTSGDFDIYDPDALPRVLDKYLPLAFSGDKEDQDAFMALWGVLMSIDGGASEPFDPNSSLRGPLRNAFQKMFGDTWEQEYTDFLKKFGGFAEFANDKVDVAEGRSNLDSGTVGANFLRLMKATSKPSTARLMRSFGVDPRNQDAMDTYTKEGSVFSLDPRPFSTKDYIDEFFPSWAPNDKSHHRVILVAEPGEMNSVSAAGLSWFEDEQEHLGSGTFKVTGVERRPSNLPGRADEIIVRVERASKSEAPASSQVPARQILDVSGWEKTRDKVTGSNEGAFYRDPSTGQEYYVKVPKSQSHAENETLASVFYDAFGVPSAEVSIGDNNGELRVTSKLIPGAASDFPDKVAENDKEYLDKIRAGFIIDAWLSNWDVTGTGYDNVMSDENGNPVRVDPGGALMWRAQGAPKDELGGFGDEVTEIDTMRDPSRSSYAGPVFESLTDDDLREQAKMLLDMPPSRIDAIVDSVVTDPASNALLKERLKARRQNILDRFGLSDESLMNEPVSLGRSMGIAARDLQPGDVTTNDSFTIERVFRDSDTPKGKVSVEGYYPGHESQRKEWNEGTVIDAARDATTPPKGDKPALHRPKKPYAPTPPAFTGSIADELAQAKTWDEVRGILRGRDLIFFDYETTGIGDGANNVPVQLGAVRVRDGKIVDRFNVFMDPLEELSPWSRENLKDADGNPLTDEYLAQQVGLAEAHSLFADWAGPDAILGAHNTPFDKEVLERIMSQENIDFTPAGYVDTLRLARDLVPKRTKKNPDGTEGHRLPQLLEHYGIESGDWHTADADAESSANLMNSLLDDAASRPDADVPDFVAQSKDYEGAAAEHATAVESYKDELADYNMQKAVAAAWHCGGIIAAAEDDGNSCNVPSVDDLIDSSTVKPGQMSDPEAVTSGEVGADSNPYEDVDAVDSDLPATGEKEDFAYAVKGEKPSDEAVAKDLGFSLDTAEKYGEELADPDETPLKPSLRKHIANSLEELKAIKDGINSGDLSNDDAIERLNELIDDIPEVAPTTDAWDHIETFRDYVMDARNILTGSYYQRPTGKDLPPPEEKNRGYSKDGVFIQPGTRVRDKWGYLGTVVRYNKNGWVNVYFQRDLDGKVFSKGTQHLTTVSDDDDQSPWTYSPKVPVGKRPSNWEEMVSAEQRAAIDAEEAKKAAAIKEVKKAEWKAKQAAKKSSAPGVDTAPTPEPEPVAEPNVAELDEPGTLSIQDIADSIAMNNSTPEEMRGALGAYAKSQNLSPADVAHLSRMLGLDDEGDGDGGDGGLPPNPTEPGDGGGDNFPKGEAPEGAPEAPEVDALDAAEAEEVKPVSDPKKYQRELEKIYNDALGDAVYEENALLLRGYQEDPELWLAANMYLRGDKTLDEILEEFNVDSKDVVDTVKALREEIERVPGLPEDTILYRGTRKRSAEKLFKLEVGDTYEDKGFVSTSLDYDTAEEFSRIHLEVGADKSEHGVVVEIVAPAGTKAISLGAYFNDELDPESEIILPDGMSFVVLSKTDATDDKPRTMRVMAVPSPPKQEQKKKQDWGEGAFDFGGKSGVSRSGGINGKERGYLFFDEETTTPEQLLDALKNERMLVFKDKAGKEHRIEIERIGYNKDTNTYSVYNSTLQMFPISEMKTADKPDAGKWGRDAYVDEKNSRPIGHSPDYDGRQSGTKYIFTDDTTPEELKEALLTQEKMLLFTDRHGFEYGMYVSSIDFDEASQQFVIKEWNGHKQFLLSELQPTVMQTPDKPMPWESVSRIIRLNDIEKAIADGDVKRAEELRVKHHQEDAKGISIARGVVRDSIVKYLESGDYKAAATIAAQYLAALDKKIKEVSDEQGKDPRNIATLATLRHIRDIALVSMYGDGGSADVAGATTYNYDGSIAEKYYEEFEKTYDKLSPDRLGSGVTGTGVKEVEPENPKPISESSFKNVNSLMGAIEKMLSPTRRKFSEKRRKEAIVATAAVDSGDIEDFEVRVMTVVKRSSGEKKLRLKYKLTAWAGRSLVRQIKEDKDNSDWVQDSFKVERTDADDSNNIVIYDNEYDGVFYSEKGARYVATITLPSGGEATLTLYRSDTGTALKPQPGGPRAHHNLMTIDLPIDATQEDIEYALGNGGVSQVRAASPEDMRILAENRLMSVFASKTDASVNVSDPDERKDLLRQIKDRWGIGPEDVEITTDSTGAITLKIPDTAAKTIAEATATASLQHSISAGYLKEFLVGTGRISWRSPDSDVNEALAEVIVDMITSDESGLKATLHRFMEGLPTHGMSSSDDVRSGGASYVYLTPLNHSRTEGLSGGIYDSFNVTILFDPEKAYQRLDFYANEYDEFGARNDNVDVISNAHAGAYEVMFKNGLGIDTSMAFVASRPAREAILRELKKRGIEEINGIPIDKFVTSMFSFADITAGKDDVSTIEKASEMVTSILNSSSLFMSKVKAFKPMQSLTASLSAFEDAIGRAEFESFDVTVLQSIEPDSIPIAIDQEMNLIYRTPEGVYKIVPLSPQKSHIGPKAASLDVLSSLQQSLNSYKSNFDYQDLPGELGIFPGSLTVGKFMPIGVTVASTDIQNKLNSLIKQVSDTAISSSERLMAERRLAGFIMQIALSWNNPKADHAEFVNLFIDKVKQFPGVMGILRQIVDVEEEF